MATTSIWRVKGWLGKVVIYAENPEKTATPKFYADRELTEQDGQQLSDVIRYRNQHYQLAAQAECQQQFLRRRPL